MKSAVTNVSESLLIAINIKFKFYMILHVVLMDNLTSDQCSDQQKQNQKNNKHTNKSAVVNISKSSTSQVPVP